MKSQPSVIPLKKIIQIFSRIPSNDIISIAKNIQKKLLTDENLVNKNDEKIYKLVTQADVDIQALLLSYFSNSSLKNTYNVIAEEKILNRTTNKTATWNLVIDPLDGTTSFRNQSKSWGVMVGACDNNGILRYSWNLLSTGEIFTSNCIKIIKASFLNKVKTKNNISIDVYDYGSSISNRFKEVFKTSFKIKEDRIVQTSYPAAIWAGYKLITGELDGLLWLPSNKGKKFYPDYDLVFLKALLDKGYSVIIGKVNSNNCLIVVAPTIKDTEKLYRVGLKLIQSNQKVQMKKFINELKILN